ncbi:MAG: hypothetical protein LBU61_03290 [Coriobacteriales bacterium]|nr:hypothetical protein [Coriobacteriales bacterium]
MKCVVCEKKLEDNEVFCPICGSDQTEIVAYKGNGAFVKSKANAPSCKLIITNSRLIAIDDIAAAAKAGGSGGGLLGGFIGSVAGDLIGEGIGKVLDKTVKKKTLVDLPLSSIIEINETKGNIFVTLNTCTVTTYDGINHIFKFDKKSDFTGALRQATGK